MRLIVFISLAILSAAACRKENAFDCFKGSGKDHTEARDPGAFTRIEVYDKMEVNILQGPSYKVEVIAGKNLLRNISTVVKNGILVVENKNTCNFVRGYKRVIIVNVTVPRIDRVSNFGVSSVIFDENFNQDTLVVRAENSGDFHINGTYNQIRTSSHGNGDMYLKGKCNSFAVYANGTNFVYAEDLIVKDYLFIASLTLGDCRINAKALKQLDVHLEDEGNVYYIGEPDLITTHPEDKGNGQLIKEVD